VGAAELHARMGSFMVEARRQMFNEEA